MIRRRTAPAGDAPCVVDSLEEADTRLFAFTRLLAGQWKSARTANVVERLHGESKCRIKSQTSCPLPKQPLFRALFGCRQITMRYVDGWQTLDETPSDQPVDFAA